MFFVLTDRDRVRILPKDFKKAQHAAVTDELNKKYSNKVLHNVGLCIRVFDLLEVSEGVVHACQDGSYIATVKFRMIVFRPFIGEILVGKVANSSTDGLRVSMDFFDDIIIPPPFMKPGSFFNKEQGHWVWQYVDEDTGTPQDFDMEKDEPIRFRVEGEVFIDIPPTFTPRFGGPSISNEPKTSPYALTCSIHEDGCGLLSWWT